MDWTKAKNIMIISLLITNMILGGLIFHEYLKESDSRRSYLADTLELLSARGIDVDAEIPSDRIRMPVLSVRYDNLDKSLLQREIAATRPLDAASRTDQDIQAMTDDLLERCGILSKSVRFDRIEKESGVETVIYKNVIDDIDIEDSYIKCTVADGTVTGLQRLWLEPVELGKNKKEVMPIAEALIRFMSENQEYEKIKIEKIEIVYWLDTTALGASETPVSDTAFPAWKITYNGGKIKHISAF